MPGLSQCAQQLSASGLSQCTQQLHKRLDSVDVRNNFVSNYQFQRLDSVDVRDNNFTSAWTQSMCATTTTTTTTTSFSNCQSWGSLELHLLYNLATSVGLTFRHKLVGECDNNRSSFSESGFSRNRDCLAIDTIEIIFNILATRAVFGLVFGRPLSVAVPVI